MSPDRTSVFDKICRNSAKADIFLIADLKQPGLNCEEVRQALNGIANDAKRAYEFVLLRALMNEAPRRTRATSVELERCTVDAPNWGRTWRHVTRWYRNDAPLDAIIDHVLPPFVGAAAHGVLG
jgi:hypothetical protein